MSLYKKNFTLFGPKNIIFS